MTDEDISKVGVMMIATYLCKHGGVFTGMAKGVDVPRNTRSAARPKRLIEEPQANSHLVDHSTVVSCGFVTHAPATIYKLQTA